jgi:hypothetical protein
METKVTISRASSGAGAGQPAADERDQEALAQEPKNELMVSLQAEVPEALLVSMRLFIDRHPNWDQYRLFQAAVAGFLVQNGVQSRDVTRCYLAHLFPAQGRFRCG